MKHVGSHLLRVLLETRVRRCSSHLLSLFWWWRQMVLSKHCYCPPNYMASHSRRLYQSCPWAWFHFRTQNKLNNFVLLCTANYICTTTFLPFLIPLNNCKILKVLTFKSSNTHKTANSATMVTTISTALPTRPTALPGLHLKCHRLFDTCLDGVCVQNCLCSEARHFLSLSLSLLVRTAAVVLVLGSCSDVRFESRLGHRQSWPPYLVVFLPHSKKFLS
jgi:hypothetical protein